MNYKLVIYSADGNEMFVAKSSDLDDIYAEIRAFKQTPSYAEEHIKDLDNAKFL